MGTNSRDTSWGRGARRDSRLEAMLSRSSVRSAARRETAFRRGRSRRDQGGFAMVVGLVAMTALTILGVAAVTSSSIDLKIAHNMRRLEMAKYAAMAGTEHARRNIVLGLMPSLAQTAYVDDLTASPSLYINSTDAIKMASADGSPLGTYTVTAYAVKCGGPPPGYSVDNFYSQYFDLRSVGTIDNASGTKQAPATAGAAITVRKVNEGRCYKR